MTVTELYNELAFLIAEGGGNHSVVDLSGNTIEFVEDEAEYEGTTTIGFN